MIATQDTTLTTHDGMILSNQADITTNDGMILSNQADIATNDAMIIANEASIVSNAAAIEAIEEGVPPQGNPCDADGDGGITPQEMRTYLISEGHTGSTSLSTITGQINTSEILSGSPSTNFILDSPGEINYFNGAYIIPFGTPVCPVN